MNASLPYLIITDLDGSLLDGNYSWQDAQPALDRIRQEEIPLIFNSSKTFAELKGLVEAMDLGTPVICENGGVVGVPYDAPIAQFIREPAFMGYAIMHPGLNRKHILQIAHGLRTEFNYQFQGFADWSDEEVSHHTGLPVSEATLAKRRQATEPILWRDSEAALAEFEARLNQQGIRIVNGGRFRHLMGQVDKSEGLRVISHLYQQTYPDIPWKTIALGDSANDLDMLSAAHVAGVIPDHNGHLLEPQAAHVREAPFPGPKGWNALINHFLDERTGL